MPQIETWAKLPAAVREHLIERMRDRSIWVADLNRLRLWIESKPEVPEGDWLRISALSSFAARVRIRKHFCCRGRLGRARRSDFSRVAGGECRLQKGPANHVSGH